MSQPSHVLSERTGAVTVITVNRPEALNALNSDILGELTAAVESAAHDSSIRAVVITGAGDRAFIAGADIKEMRSKSPQEGREFAARGHRIGQLIEEMDKPVIAAINGLALGGGCELALACDFRIASERARLGQPEVGLGILPGWGGTIRLARIVGEGIAREIIFTGRQVSADEALRIGLVNAVFPPGKLMEEAMSLASTIASRAPLAVAYAKRSMNRSRYLDTAASVEMETNFFALCFATEDQKEGMTAFVEKRQPDFQGK